MADATVTLSEEVLRELYAVATLPRIVRADMSNETRAALVTALEAYAPAEPPPEADAEAARSAGKPKVKDDDEQKRIEEEFDTKLEKELGGDNNKPRRGRYGS